MKIALHDSDQTKYPNLALMKISSAYKAGGHEVGWYSPILSGQYDLVCSSKIFTWTPDDPALIGEVETGGTGYRSPSVLPEEIEHTRPDYSLYGIGYAMGFTTRGCSRSCDFCVVPSKEGEIRAHAELEEFVLPEHLEVVLMDNNILAHEHGRAQLLKASTWKIKVDCNQGLDARLIDQDTATMLAKVRWTRFVRTACDAPGQLPTLRRAVKNLERAGVKPYRVFVYCLLREEAEGLNRIEELRALGVEVFAMPYRPLDGSNPDPTIKRMAAWVNHKARFKSCSWEDFRREGWNKKQQPLDQTAF